MLGSLLNYNAVLESMILISSTESPRDLEQKSNSIRMEILLKKKGLVTQ